MKKIAILVADGFEDTELIGAIDYWARENIEFELISIQNQLEVKGSYFAKVNTKPINQIELDKFDYLFLPGGQSTKLLKEFKGIQDIIMNFYTKNKGIFAICAAPSLLYELGVLKANKFTAWPGLDLVGTTNSEVEVDGNIITGRDFLATMAFAKVVADYIKKK